MLEAHQPMHVDHFFAVPHGTLVEDVGGQSGQRGESFMIGKNQLAKAVSENDNYSDRGGTMDQSLPMLGFKSDDVGYVAIQRALRMYAALKGSNASMMTMDDLRRASDEDRMLITAFAAVWTDGLAAASRALNAEGR